ncbi:3-ketoacyl-ACP reductase [Paracoccus sp. (in: a-proteobacteria)]|uniref:3-ketoacyl-ACP reductase n=1 Tax=Paracoccus sp. TaxID=267 RepID=UPI003A8A2C47
MAGRDRPVALITGAAGGLGGAIARQLCMDGFRLVLSDLDSIAELRATERQLQSKGDAVSLPHDLTDDGGREGFVAAVFGAFGRLDCLVNNAGVSVLARGDILDVSPESFDRCISVNLRAQFFLTQSVARRMRDAPSSRRRSIVTVSTVAVDHVIGTVLAEYCIAKAGLAHSIRHWAARLAREGIDCFEVRPGMMKTDMTAGTTAKYDALIAAGFVPAGRWGDSAEVARAVSLLASGQLPYSTGQTIHVDGGMRLKPF